MANKIEANDGVEESASSLLLRLEPSVSPFLALERLDLRDCALAALPSALPVCTALRTLDVGGNRALHSLDGVDALVQLRVLFATGCGLGPALPAGGPLSRCSRLRMLSIKENGIHTLDGDALPDTLHWLIAAQNLISEIRAPHRLSHVRKLMLSHNLLTADTLEPLLEAAVSLEMLRIACNDLHSLPCAISRHPALAWLALGGNPYAQRQLEARAASADGAAAAPLLTSSDDPELLISDKVLGKGSGATVKEGVLRGEPVAVKLWTAELFSDGDARGEWAVGRLTGACTHVVRTLAVFQSPQLGMVLELLRGARAASGPPTFDTITRDALDAGKDALEPADALYVAVEVGSACTWLHAHGIMHGDVYLHNTLLVRSEATGAAGATGVAGAKGVSTVRLSDFGASTTYDRAADGHVLERLEVRAFGKLLEDLAALCTQAKPAAPGKQDGAWARQRLGECARACGNTCLGDVPSFEELVCELRLIAAAL